MHPAMARIGDLCRTRARRQGKGAEMWASAGDHEGLEGESCVL